MYGKRSAKRRIFWLGTTALLLTTAACTLILDRSTEQCSSNTDCGNLGPRAVCQENVCVANPGDDAGKDQNVPDTNTPLPDSNVPDNDVPDNNSPPADGGADADDGGGFGIPGCFRGTPTTNEQFLNACTTSSCIPFDNCARLGICDAGLLGPSPPPGPPPPGTTPPNSTATLTCDSFAAAANKQIVYVTGSSNFPPFLSSFAPVIAKDGYAVVWQTSNSCAGVDSAYNAHRTTGTADPVKGQIKEQNGRTTLFFKEDGTTSPCLLNGPTNVDVGESDIYAKSCEANIGYDPTLVSTSLVGEYVGPILPMLFIVPAASSQDVLSAEAGQAVFGRGGAPDASAPLPFTDPTQLFIRSSSTATNQIISRGIFVEPTKWWGVDKGTAQILSAQMLAVSPSLAEKTIGIISADFADRNRGNIKALAFQSRTQTCGFFPDSTKFSLDKRNVRDGHYSMWGPLHFFTKLNGSTPATPGASAFVTRFAKAFLDQDLLESEAKGGVIPSCAMKVTRDFEMGPVRTYNPPSHCGCFYDKVANNNVVPSTCKVCTSTADCTDPGRPACNYGFCEAR